MDFTREPIIETVITPKEGCKLVVRSSKSNAQEEHFVDALEVVSFGHSFFFRSLERPKTFLVPATDYEILEVREARMVLKNVGIDRAIKIGGGREGQMRTQKEPLIEKAEFLSEDTSSTEEELAGNQPVTEKPQEGRVDKKRDRRRNYRRRRGKDGTSEEENQERDASAPKIELQEPHRIGEGENSPLAQQVLTTSILTSLLPPPPNLISETIGLYKDNELFKDAFYTKEKKVPIEAFVEAIEAAPEIPQPEYGTFELSEEEEEQIYLKRKKGHLSEEEADDVPEKQEQESGTEENGDESEQKNHEHPDGTL